MIISDNYKASLEELQNNNRFKGLLVKYDPVKEFIDKYKPQTVIDYGCAKGALVNQLRTDYPSIVVDGYDPGVPEFSKIPNTAYDCLLSNDVIEHFEPEFLNQTLTSMDKLFTKSAWLIIACYPAKKTLPDGRNAHLIIEKPEWWEEVIKNTFNSSTIAWKDVVEFKPGKPELRIILEK